MTPKAGAPTTTKRVDWVKYFKPLFQQYEGRKHPLEYKNPYQLVVAVILSARDSDKHINEITPEFFKKFPSLNDLARVRPEELYPYIGSVTNFANKAKWLVNLAITLGSDKNIPKTMKELTELSGIGRKSANVIMSELGYDMEGVIVDLHVLRVAPRIGVATGINPEKVEKQLMDSVPQKYWKALGMGLSFLGREICRPSNPKCPMCVMNVVCAYYKSQGNKH